MLRKTMLIHALTSFVQIAISGNHDWSTQIVAFKPMVVNIEVSKQIVFEDESRGTFYATGFVVDSGRGIIATNSHVAESSPSSVKIGFSNGSFTEARTLYYDPRHDFAFYQIDPSKIRVHLEEVTLGTADGLKAGDDLLLIGNNEREQYSLKFGTVANVNINKGRRYSSYIHTTFDRTGGSSGSPVWNTKGEVIGIHALGTAVSSFELCIDYLRDALRKIQQNIPIRRGDIGVDIQLISIGDAIQYFRLPESTRAELRLLPTAVTRVMQVESVVPRSSGYGDFKPGDIIYRLDGGLVKDDLYRFDVYLDSHVGDSVKVDIYRHGNLNSISLFVEDMEKSKVYRFVRFAGAVFHELTPYQRRNLDFGGDGVYLPYAVEGSSFSSLGDRRDNGDFWIVISELNGIPVRNLDDLIAACKTLQNDQYTSVELRDFAYTNRSRRAKGLTIDLRYEPLEVYQFDRQSLEWTKAP